MKSNMRICPQCGTETTALTCRHDGFGTVDAARYQRNDPATLIGTLFQDRYRVDSVLGSGGMGSVYQATQVRVGRQVALKVINAELAWDLAVVARFQREGRAIASLIHPNIVQVFDFGQTDEGQLFMAMELVTGKTLADVIREDAPMEASRVVHIGAQVFDALAEAHEHGVIHRDLKPENIFITETGRRRDVVKILDFGVAKIVNEPKTESMVTARGAILGSPRYMAPEQARGKGVTGHADLYAVGGILYEMLTGRAVFNEPSPADYLVAHSVKMPPTPSIAGRELHGPIVDLILKCLEKKPWNRPDGAARALEVLEACRLGPLTEGLAAPAVRTELAAVASERAVGALSTAGVGVVAPVTTSAQEPPPIPLSVPSISEVDEEYEDEDEEDLRPRVVAPGIVKREPSPLQVHETDVAIASLDTKRVGERAALTHPRTSSPEQDHPTTIGPGLSTAAGMQVVEERGRGGLGLFVLAAVLLLFAGGLIFLAENNFFRGGRRGAAVVVTDRMSEAVVDPVPSGPGPVPESRAGERLASADRQPVGRVKGADTPALAQGSGSLKVVAGAELKAEPGAEQAPGAMGAGSHATASELGEAQGKASGDDRALAVASPDGSHESGERRELRERVVTSAGATTNEELVVKDTVKVQRGSRAGDRSGSNSQVKHQLSAARTAARASAREAARAREEAEQERRAAERARAEAERVRREAERRAAIPKYEDPLGDLEDPEFPDKAQDRGNLRRVLVSSSPSGATIRMGSLTLGRTPLYVEWKDFGQPVSVTLTKVGFRTYRAALSSAQSGIKATLDPISMEDNSNP